MKRWIDLVGQIAECWLLLGVMTDESKCSGLALHGVCLLCVEAP